jgi:hypothetical protein
MMQGLCFAEVTALTCVGHRRATVYNQGHPSSSGMLMLTRVIHALSYSTGCMHVESQAGAVKNVYLSLPTNYVHAVLLDIILPTSCAAAFYLHGRTSTVQQLMVDTYVTLQEFSIAVTGQHKILCPYSQGHSSERVNLMEITRPLMSKSLNLNENHKATALKESQCHGNHKATALKESISSISQPAGRTHRWNGSKREGQTGRCWDSCV